MATDRDRFLFAFGRSRQPDLAPMQEIAFIAFVDETIKPSLEFRPPNPEKFPLIALTR
jgi:hypothetical protein